VIHTENVRLGEQATVGVDGQLSPQLDPAALDEAPSFTPLAETGLLDLCRNRSPRSAATPRR
jgi:hypothetical protein